MARQLTIFDDYTREEVQGIFDPSAVFTRGAGLWGLRPGIVPITKGQETLFSLYLLGVLRAITNLTKVYPQKVPSNGSPNQDKGWRILKYKSSFIMMS